MNAAEERAIWTPSETSASQATETDATITGCLEQRDDGFRLKDTSGADAPQARSWKSGFLKRGNATIDVVADAHLTTLGGHVGERVRITGPLEEREIRVRSLQRVAPSC